jgi:Skp family chaperone for outer membrane proteins
MNLKKHFLALGIALSVPHAAEATTIVTASPERSFQESLAGKNIQDKITKKQASLAAPLQKTEKELQDLQQELMDHKQKFEKAIKDFEKEAKLLSAEAKELKAEEFQKEQQLLEQKHATLQQKYKQFQETVQQLERKMSDFSQKEIQAFQEQFQQAVSTVAKHEKWDIVLTEGGALFVDKKLDQTDLITKELNKMHEDFNKDKAAKTGAKAEAKAPEAAKTAKKAA